MPGDRPDCRGGNSIARTNSKRTRIEDKEMRNENMKICKEILNALIKSYCPKSSIYYCYNIVSSKMDYIVII